MAYQYFPRRLLCHGCIALLFLMDSGYFEAKIENSNWPKRPQTSPLNSAVVFVDKAFPD